MPRHRPRLRHAVRALVLDEARRILLCRFDLPHNVVWACPGGGIDPGESLFEALRRELDEEIGLDLAEEPPHVWHQVVEGPGYAKGHDGVVNDYFLVDTPHFSPRGSLSAEELAAEDIAAIRWWAPSELAAYQGDAVFSPRELAVLLADVLDNGVPAAPLPLGL